MNEYFIIIGAGYWGSGKTEKRAYSNYKDAGAARGDPHTLKRFSSKLPFAPRHRKASEDEADAWFSGDGSTTHVRCNIERWDVDKKGDRTKLQHREWDDWDYDYELTNDEKAVIKMAKKTE